MVLVIDELAHKEIRRIKKYAYAHKIDRNKLMRMMKFLDPPVGDQPEYCCILGGVKVVYSVENQPVGWCDHLSFSVGKEGALPSVPAVEMLMREFGLVGIIGDCASVWIEQGVSTANGKKGDAINILQRSTLLQVNVIECSICQGEVDRHEHSFICTNCGAMGDPVKGLMSYQDIE